MADEKTQTEKSQLPMSEETKPRITGADETVPSGLKESKQTPGDKQPARPMPEKTFVNEINPQEGSPAVPSRAPEGAPGTSLEKDLHKTDADKETVRKATDERARANVKETQATKQNPPRAAAATVTPDAVAAQFSAVLPSDVVSSIVADPQGSMEIPVDERDSVHPQKNTIEMFYPAGAPVKQVNLSSIIHPGTQDPSEMNRQLAAEVTGKSARGNATVELMRYVDERRKNHIRRMQQVQLVLKNSSMDTQQEERVLRQIGEIFSE